MISKREALFNCGCFELCVCENVLQIALMQIGHVVFFMII